MENNSEKNTEFDNITFFLLLVSYKYIYIFNLLILTAYFTNLDSEWSKVFLSSHYLTSVSISSSSNTGLNSSSITIF